MEGRGGGWEKFFGFQSGNSQTPQNWNFSRRTEFGSEAPKYPPPPTQIGTSRGELQTVWQCADHSVYRKVTIWLHTIGPTKNEYGYKYSFRKSRFLSIKIIDSNVKKFGYNEHSLARRSFFRIFLLISGIQCRRAGKSTRINASFLHRFSFNEIHKLTSRLLHVCCKWCELQP